MRMQIGRTVFGGAAAALGVIGMAWGAFAFAWQPVPPDLPGYGVLAYVAGALLLVGGVGTVVGRGLRIHGILLGLVFTSFAIPWAVRVVRYPQMFGTWGGLAENVSLIIAAVIVTTNGSAHASATGGRVENACIKAYGVCAVVFGFNHFFALQETAKMVPQWLPPTAMFWAAATGVFHCAAGIAILTGFRALLAARLLACMMLVFEALVWIPYLAKSPGTHMLWAGNGTDVVLAGAALVVADALARRATRRGDSRQAMQVDMDPARVSD